MKKFIILIFSCLLSVSCYNRSYCEEVNSSCKSTIYKIEDCYNKRDRILDQMHRYGWSQYLHNEFYETYDDQKELESKYESLRLELIKARYPMKKVEKLDIEYKAMKDRVINTNKSN